MKGQKNVQTGRVLLNRAFFFSNSLRIKGNLADRTAELKGQSWGNASFIHSAGAAAASVTAVYSDCSSVFHPNDRGAVSGSV